MHFLFLKQCGRNVCGGRYNVIVLPKLRKKDHVKFRGWFMMCSVSLDIVVTKCVQGGKVCIQRQLFHHFPHTAILNAAFNGLI